MESWDILEGNWEKLRLNSDEEDPIQVEDEFSVSNRIKERRSLLGKLCLDSMVGKEVLRTTMGKIWKISKPAIFRDLGSNLFSITFESETDKLKVSDGRPWLFDNNLFVQNNWMVYYN